MRRQKAVYWGNPTSDGEGGKQVDLPVEIDCRFEYETIQIRTANGEEYTSRSQCYTDRDVVLGGFLYNGTLASLDGAEDPEETDDAEEIRHFSKLPVLKVRTDGLDPNADEYLRTAYL